MPYAEELSARLCSDDDPLENAMKVGAHHLARCYRALSSDEIFAGPVLVENSRKFAAQFVALEAATPAKYWKIKPKLHLFLELCLGEGLPSLCWTYRDEDFGGSCAHMARRRGGEVNPTATSASLLQRFMIRQPMIHL